MSGFFGDPKSSLDVKETASELSEPFSEAEAGASEPETELQMPEAL